MRNLSLFMLSAVGLFTLCGVGCSANTGSTDEESLGSAQSELTGWLGPISDESGLNNRSFSQANIAATNAFCSGSYCDNNYLYGSALPSGVTTGTEHPTGLFISEESPNNQSFCVNTSGFIDGVVTGLAASGNYSDNLELLCSPLTFSGSHRWGSCKWTSWFSEENGGYPTGWTSGYYATGLACSGSNCDNVRYYVCNFL
jgi:hypothetical protein